MFKKVKKNVMYGEMHNGIKYYVYYQRTRFYVLWIPVYTNLEMTGKEKALVQ